jgi:hypothetical protein
MLRPRHSSAPLVQSSTLQSVSCESLIAILARSANAVRLGSPDQHPCKPITSFQTPSIDRLREQLNFPFCDHYAANVPWPVAIQSPRRCQSRHPLHRGVCSCGSALGTQERGRTLAIHYLPVRNLTLGVEFCQVPFALLLVLTLGKFATITKFGFRVSASGPDFPSYWTKVQ